MPVVAPDHLTYAFDDAPEADKQLLGGKGAGLVKMVRLGLAVPPGFILTTPCGHAYLSDGALPERLVAEVDERIAALEAGAGRRFGDDARPLLISVRSGAPVSMPGMMDTILNVGLTAGGVAALEAESGGGAHFAWSSFERLLHGFATTVRSISAGVVEDALLDLPAGSDAATRCDALLALIEAESGRPFPDARGQLLESVEAVFRSWNSPRAKAYRRHKGIDDGLGTAVVVQRMVFGNRGETSGSGVCFTRDPATGEAGAYGDILFDAQGEDVVAGERDTLPVAALAERMPDVAVQLEAVCRTLEADTRDLCDIEFTVEEGALWILQTRVGQRAARAAVKLAVAFCEEGTITVEEALARVSEEQLQTAQAPIFADVPDEDAVIARGLACSPGAIVGVAALTCEAAQKRAEAGETVVLVRPTTAPADLPGVLAAAAVVTERGGRASHAAVVARGLDRPAVCGTGPTGIADGDVVSVDGDRGLVLRGEQPLHPAHADPQIKTFLEWHDAHRS
jgi:pyruvate,orthophosphate dikinase